MQESIFLFEHFRDMSNRETGINMDLLVTEYIYMGDGEQKSQMLQLNAETVVTMYKISFNDDRQFLIESLRAGDEEQYKTVYVVLQLESGRSVVCSSEHDVQRLSGNQRCLE